MRANPLDIVEEYLRSPDPQVRRNAVTALAAIESDESLRKLATASLDNADSETQQRAVDEILNLRPDVAARTVKYFEDALGDKKKAVLAYAMLGRLRTNGVSAAAAGEPLFRRLYLAARVKRTPRRIRQWRFRLRAFFPTLLGWILGVVILVILTWAMHRNSIADDGNTTAFLIVSGLVSCVLGLLVSQHESAFELQPSTVLAIVVEVGYSLLSCLGLSLLVSLLYLLFALTDRDPDVATMVGKFLVKVVALVIAIRLGTLAVFGIFSRRITNGLAELIVGACAGTILLTTIPILSRTVDDDYSNGTWIMLIPVCFAVALSFARSDAVCPKFWPIMGRLAPPLSLATVAIVAIGSVAAFAPYSSSISALDLQLQKQKPPLVLDASYGDQRLPLTNSNMVWRLRVNSPLILSATIEETDWELELSDEAGTSLARDRFVPRISKALSVGNYELVAQTIEEGTPLLSGVVHRALARLKRQSERSSTIVTASTLELSVSANSNESR